MQEFARQPLSGPEAKPCLARLTDRGWDSNFRFSVSLPPRNTLGNWSGRIGFSPSTFSREIDEEGRLDEVLVFRLDRGGELFVFDRMRARVSGKEKFGVRIARIAR